MDVIRVPCEKKYRRGDSRVLPVELVVCHWTASPPKAPGVADEARMRAWLANADRQTSTHLIVLRDGSVLQAADLDERTWHAGGSEWRRPDGTKVKSINGRSIGLDVENVGWLRRAPDGHGFLDGYGGRYRGFAPVRTQGGWHEPLTAPQVAALLDVAAWLGQEIPVLREASRWVGHSEIQPGKMDPGPLFPWASVRSAAAGDCP